jgi:hypothetical protein
MITQHESKHKKVGRYDVFRTWNEYNGQRSMFAVQVLDRKFEEGGETEWMWAALQSEIQKDRTVAVVPCRSMLLITADTKEDSKEIAKEIKQFLKRK